MLDRSYAEAVRQVSVHCVERGELLAAIHEHYSRLFSRLTEEREREITALRQTFVDELQRQAQKSSKGAPQHSWGHRERWRDVHGAGGGSMAVAACATTTWGVACTKGDAPLGHALVGLLRVVRSVTTPRPLHPL